MPLFEKGVQRSVDAGRKKGVPNKRTEQWNQFVAHVMSGGLDKFRTELAKLKGRNYVEAYLKLLEFHQPKLSRTAITNTYGNAMPIIHIMLPPKKIQQTIIKLPVPSKNGKPKK